VSDPARDELKRAPSSDLDDDCTDDPAVANDVVVDAKHDVAVTALLVDTPAPLIWHRRPALQRRLRLLGRLREMTPAELAHRVGRVAAKRFARLGAGGDTDATADGGSVGDLPEAMTASPTSYLAARDCATGFFDVGERTRLARLASTQLGNQVEHTVGAAGAILDGGVELLGRRFHPAEPGFDWLADPIRGRVWPLTVMDDADAVRRVDADVKYIWEVNRHQFLATVARAYAYSEREEYAGACIGMVDRWIEMNPPGIGVNWSSNLEIAVRSISWMWSIQFLLGSGALDDRMLETWLASLRRHRDYLVEHLSVYTDPTNHLIGEAAALAMLSIWLPEWNDSRRCRELAISTLTDAVAFQVAEDGIDIEQATSYQRFVLDLVLQVIALADRNAVEVPPVLRSRAQAMLEAVADLIGHGSRAPRIGDSDDARGLPFFTQDFWDFGELLAIGAAVLGDETGFAYGRPLTESAFWLGGGSRFPSASAANEPQGVDQPKLLSQGGYAILPSGADPRSDRLIFDCGPLGYMPHCSHGHADLLSVLVNVGGEEFLVDPGTFAYHDDLGRRDVFRATRSHNTVEVGGRDQADAFDPFKWLNIPDAALERWYTGIDFQYAEAWHDGYRRIVAPLRHRRGVLALHGGWLLLDWLEGNASHRFDRWFHAAPTTRVSLLDPSTVLVESDDTDKALRVADLGSGTPAVLGTAPYSERYGQMIAAPAFRFADSAPLPAVRATLLTVDDGGSERLQLAEVTHAPTGDGLSIALVDAGGRCIRVDVRNADTSTSGGAAGAHDRIGIVSLSGPDGEQRERLPRNTDDPEHQHAI